MERPGLDPIYGAHDRNDLWPTTSFLFLMESTISWQTGRRGSLLAHYYKSMQRHVVQSPTLLDLGKRCNRSELCESGGVAVYLVTKQPAESTVVRGTSIIEENTSRGGDWIRTWMLGFVMLPVTTT